MMITKDMIGELPNIAGRYFRDMSTEEQDRLFSAVELGLVEVRRCSSCSHWWAPVKDREFLGLSVYRIRPSTCRRFVRIRPSMIRIGDFDVPEPEREALECGDAYYVPDQWQASYYERLAWKCDDYDTRALERGLVHRTSGAAELHGKALASLTAK